MREIKLIVGSDIENGSWGGGRVAGGPCFFSSLQILLQHFIWMSQYPKLLASKAEFGLSVRATPFTGGRLVQLFLGVPKNFAGVDGF